MSGSDEISLIKTLREKIFLNDLTENKELEKAAALFTGREYQRKQILLMAGEKWDKVFFIRKGIVRLYYTDQEGKEFNKGFFSEGQLVWPVAPSARKNKSLFFISALEDIKVSVCGFSAFYSFLNRLGFWEKFALQYAELFSDEKFLREYEFLIHSASKRYLNFCTEHPELAQRIPDYHLASYLGITNVSLSRIKKTVKF